MRSRWRRGGPLSYFSKTCKETGKFMNNGAIQVSCGIFAGYAGPRELANNGRQATPFEEMPE